MYCISCVYLGRQYVSESGESDSGRMENEDRAVRRGGEKEKERGKDEPTEKGGEGRRERDDDDRE